MSLITRCSQLCDTDARARSRDWLWDGLRAPARSRAVDQLRSGLIPIIKASTEWAFRAPYIRFASESYPHTGGPIERMGGPVRTLCGQKGQRPVRVADVFPGRTLVRLPYPNTAALLSVQKTFGPTSIQADNAPVLEAFSYTNLNARNWAENNLKSIAIRTLQPVHHWAEL